jgi:ubiquinone/menaquinone biosynthesis C-methylase UbiE
MSRSTRPLGLLLAALILVGALAWQPATTRAGDDEAERDSVLKLIGARSGEVIADVGCGHGRWTMDLAQDVGEHGTIYAQDIDPRKIEAVRQLCEREGLKNVKLVQSLPDDPMLPKNALDAIFINDVINYVDRAAQAGFLDGIRSALKPAGRLIIRDPKGNPDRVISECYRAGFILVEAKIPLGTQPIRMSGGGWYALKLRRAENTQPAILPRRGEPERYRTRLHLAEELFRMGLFTREEFAATWEAIQNAPGDFDPQVDEALDAIGAAEALDIVDATKAAELKARARKRAREGR